MSNVYGKVYRSLWRDKDFRGLHEDSRILLLYLMSCPHGYSFGYFAIPDQYILADLQWGSRRLSKAWKFLKTMGFVKRNDADEVVFLEICAKESPPENQNQIKAWQKLIGNVPKSELILDFITTAKKYWPNGWQTAWLSELEETVPLTVPQTVTPTVPLIVPPTVDQTVTPTVRQTNRYSNNNRYNNKTPKGGCSKKPPNPEVKIILDEMKRHLGYPEKMAQDPIPDYGPEGKAITRMLTRRFTREEILGCWKAKVIQRGGEFVSMTWVNKDIRPAVKAKEGRHVDDKLGEGPITLKPIVSECRDEMQD